MASGRHAVSQSVLAMPQIIALDDCTWHVRASASPWTREHPFRCARKVRARELGETRELVALGVSGIHPHEERDVRVAEPPVSDRRYVVAKRRRRREPDDAGVGTILVAEPARTQRVTDASDMGWRRLVGRWIEPAEEDRQKSPRLVPGTDEKPVNRRRGAFRPDAIDLVEHCTAPDAGQHGLAP